MLSDPVSASRKRPVNLTLSEEVVASARRYSDNLSATVETLLTTIGVESWCRWYASAFCRIRPRWPVRV